MSKAKKKKLRSLVILQDIKSGKTDPSLLASSERKLLVSLLMVEGQSTAEIAHLLQVSDRTIERDKQAIRSGNALEKDPQLASLVAGRLVNEAQVCIQRMRKFQRDNNCPPSVKVEAEKSCFHVVDSLAERLQSMGYLPTATQKLQANLTHHSNKSLSFDEIQAEAQRLKEIESSQLIRKKKKKKKKKLKRRRVKREDDNE